MDDTSNAGKSTGVHHIVCAFDVDCAECGQITPNSHVACGVNDEFRFTQ
jgi:hypothetical protein